VSHLSNFVCAISNSEIEMLSMKGLNYVLALVLILSIVFVEDIDILYNPWMIGFMMTLFVLTSLFYCKDNLGIGMLITVLFVLVYIRFCHHRVYAVEPRESPRHGN
jgi:hypothetical protein